MHLCAVNIHDMACHTITTMLIKQSLFLDLTLGNDRNIINLQSPEMPSESRNIISIYDKRLADLTQY